jgi:hypothetical protein
VAVLTASLSATSATDSRGSFVLFFLAAFAFQQQASSKIPAICC